MAHVTLILGGARSGKSARALALADPPKNFLATAEPIDDEMADRIARHKAERGPEWRLIEAPLDIATEIAGHRIGTLVVDCLTIWLSNAMYFELEIEVETDALLGALAEADGRVILVSNEVGLSTAPGNALARAFRDAQGRLNQAVAAAADRVEFVAAGLPLVLKDDK